jgi:hypothetical protein
MEFGTDGRQMAWMECVMAETHFWKISFLEERNILASRCTKLITEMPSRLSPSPYVSFL